MIIYIVLFLYTIIASYIGGNTNNKSIRNFSIISSLFFLVFIAGFRINLGTDYLGYISLFENMGEGKEILTYAISSLLHKYKINYQYFFVVYSFFTIGFFYLFFLNINKKYVWIILAAFLGLQQYYFQTFNLVRQMLAVSIIAYAITQIENKTKFIILALLGILSHTSAIFAIPIIILIEIIKKHKGNLLDYTIYLIAVLTNLLMDTFAISILQNISILSSLNYSEYLQDDLLNRYYADSKYLGPIFFINIITTLIIIANKKKLYTFELGNKYYYYYLFGQVIYLFFSFNETFTRISYYINVFYFVMIPFLLYLINKKYLRQLILILFCFFTMMYLLNVLNEDSPFVPYRNYFFEK